NNNAPGLPQLQQIAPPGPDLAFLVRCRRMLIGDDHFQFSGANPIMFLWRVVQPSPKDQPDKPQTARDHERRSPSPAKINPQHNKWSDGRPDRRTTIKKRSSQRTLA